MQNAFLGFNDGLGFFRRFKQHCKENEDCGGTSSRNEPDAIPHMIWLGGAGAEGIDDSSRKPRANEHSNTECCERDEALCCGPQIPRRFAVDVNLSRHKEEV